MILLEHVLNVEALFPAQLREETSPTGSHFSLQKEQHDLWEFNGVRVLSPGGCSALSWWAGNFPSLQWHHGPRSGSLPHGALIYCDLSHYIRDSDVLDSMKDSPVKLSPVAPSFLANLSAHLIHIETISNVDKINKRLSSESSILNPLYVS